jgi:hypothetical protein
MIRELRILPPLAIGRFGGASTPMGNYDAVVDPVRPLGHRTLRPAETLEVDAQTGEIARAFMPERVTFTEDGRVRPVAPFLEVWADTGAAELEPLTTELLRAEGASPSDLRWRVLAGNLKVYRRTRVDNDRVEADTLEFSDHAARPLEGRCEHFWPSKVLPLGHVRYIKPSAAHPEIRLRFTPAAGHVYGSSRSEPGAGPPDDPNVVEVLYDANRGSWLGYSDSGDATTAPAEIYAGRREENGAWISRGYLDDGCDGIVRVQLTLGDQVLSAAARFGAGPPTYAPDSAPVRTVADELEQALLGPTVGADEASLERVEEIVRRAFETVRLMNTAAMNSGGMAGHDARQPIRRRRDPIMAPSLVDDAALENLHQSLLVALRSGTAPWFADVLRDYDEIGDLTDRGRRKMPAMMRGADGRHLALTRRQIDLIRTLTRGPIFPDDGATP